MTSQTRHTLEASERRMRATERAAEKVTRETMQRFLVRLHRAGEDLRTYLPRDQWDAHNERCNAAHKAAIASCDESDDARRRELERRLAEAKAEYRASLPRPGSFDYELAVMRGLKETQR